MRLEMLDEMVIGIITQPMLSRNAQRNGHRNPQWWGDFSQLQIQIKQKSHFEFVPRDTSEFKSNQKSQFDDFVP